MRAFIAVDLNDDLKDKVLDIQNNLKRTNAPVKFVEEDNLHFTCKFLGEVSQHKIDQIMDAVTKQTSNYQPFQIKIKGVGVFPHPRRIRVIWLGLEDVNYFSNLLKGLDGELSNLGFKKERSYVPHLTIGRVKGSRNKEALAQKISDLDVVDVGTMNVEKIELKKSKLTPKGPIYSTVKEFIL